MTAADLLSWRKSRGLTQAEAARIVSRHANTWRLWELGRYPIPSWVWIVLARHEEGVRR